MKYTGQSSGWDDKVCVYDGFMVIEERNLESSGTLLRRYYYEDGINMLAFIEDNVESKDYAVLTDDRGSVMGLVDASTTSIVEKLYYNSTGLCKAYTSGGTAKTDSSYNIGRSEYVPFGYLGMYHDEFTGKYHTHYREFDPVHNRWLSEDPAGYSDGLGLSAVYMGVNFVDELGLAIYAFDGTNNNARKDSVPTNVALLYAGYARTNGSSKGAHYWSGVGTYEGESAGGVSGQGGRRIVEEAYSALADNFAKGDKEIVIVGFSRGAALAREFANMIAKRYPNAQIRFLGIFDTVAQFGLPDGENDNEEMYQMKKEQAT